MAGWYQSRLLREICLFKKCIIYLICQERPSYHYVKHRGFLVLQNIKHMDVVWQRFFIRLSYGARNAFQLAEVLGYWVLDNDGELFISQGKEVSNAYDLVC